MSNSKKTSVQHGTKMKLIAEFESYSKFDFAGNPRCVDLIDIKKENGKLVSKRICIRHIGKFNEAGELRKGDIISFDGWVLMGKVSHPTKVTKIRAPAVSEEIPLEPLKVASGEL